MDKFSLLLVVLLAALTGFVGSAHAGGKDFHDQEIKGQDFTKDDLKGADFSEAVLHDCNFYKGNVPGANFKGAEVNGQFAFANAAGADFHEAKLNLFAYNADFSKANFEGVDMTHINLLENKFRGANLKHTKGWSAVWSCDFSDADLRGANLRGMTWRSEVVPRFRGATYDEDTTWPEGFDPKAAGAILSKEPAPAAAQAD